MSAPPPRRGPTFRERAERRLERVRYLLANLPGLSALHELRGRVDQQVVDCRRSAPEVDLEVSCPEEPGCWGCCRGPVPAFPTEVDRVEVLMDAAAWDRVAASREAVQAADLAMPCPLLDPETRACTVYPERPLSCRAHLVTSPVDRCYPERGAGTRQQVVSEPYALFGAVSEARGPTDALAALLLERLDARLDAQGAEE